MLGHMYAITYEATDSCANSATASAIVSVALSRSSFLR
jgi:hypothetical protein